MADKLFIYNSLTKEKNQFKPIDENHVRLYVCGPTVYSVPHLGNARSAVIYDVLYRLLGRLYKKVTYVRNVTDVDDKINKAAVERGITIGELTKEVLAEYHLDMKELGNLEPTIEPNVTDNMADVIKMISELIEKGHAYESEGHVYFSVKSFDDYGKLSGRKLEDLVSGARIEVSENKKDPYDFVLWKPAKETDDKSSIFKSPWSDGRPGWHIECSALSRKFLGEEFDIHGGGADLKFPHHENEIAQSECANDKNFARYWVHNGFLTVNGEKMSKSLGNFITVRELLDSGINGRVLRYIFLTTHYRKPLDYNYKILEDSRGNLEKIDNKIAGVEPDIKAKLPQEFLDSLLDDLNLSKAFSFIIKLSKSKSESDVCDLANIIEFLGLTKKQVKKEIPDDIKIMLKKIQNFRMEKKYEEADKLRDEITKKGYSISYDPSGEVIVKEKL